MLLAPPEARLGFPCLGPSTGVHMNARFRRRSLGIVGMVALISMACRADPSPGTPEAATEGERWIRRMSDVLAGAAVLRFETTETHDYVPFQPGAGPVALRRSAVVRRPDRLFFEFTRTGPEPTGGAAYYDGRTLTLRSDRDRVWAQTMVPPTLDDMFDDMAIRLAIPMAIADVLYSSPHESFITPTTRGGFVRRERVGARSCVELAYVAETTDFRIWIDASDRPLPCRLEITYKQLPERPVSRIEFTSWELASVVDDHTFTFRPPDGYVRIRFAEAAVGDDATIGMSDKTGSRGR